MSLGPGVFVFVIKISRWLPFALANTAGGCSPLIEVKEPAAITTGAKCIAAHTLLLLFIVWRVFANFSQLTGAPKNRAISTHICRWRLTTHLRRFDIHQTSDDMTPHDGSAPCR
jgi:hypothetical protein